MSLLQFEKEQPTGLLITKPLCQILQTFRGMKYNYTNSLVTYHLILCYRNLRLLS